MRIRAGLAIVLLVAAGCGRSEPAPTAPEASASGSPPENATVAVAATGLDPCADFPVTCTHFVALTGPDGTVHEGWFDDHRREPASPPPTLVGDIPTSLAPGRYQVTITKETVSDVASSVPVPNGTPRMTGRGDVLATCRAVLDVAPAERITVTVAFAPDAAPFQPTTCEARVATG